MRFHCLRSIAAATAGVLLAVAAWVAPTAAQTPVKVGWCTKALSSAASPWAIAIKLGWADQAGLKVTVIPTAGGGDCMKLVANREFIVALSGIEPLATVRENGIDMKIFYTAYRSYVFGISVPAGSTVKTVADLKGRKIGINSMGSNGIMVAKAMVTDAGLDPLKDVNIVVVGEGAQAAAQIKNGQVDGYSAFDTAFALVENAGVPLRALPNANASRFPSSGMYAMADTLKNRRKDIVALGQMFAKGQIFAMANPEAAVRIMWEVWPQTRPTAISEAEALANEIKTLGARAASWRLDSDKRGVTKWGLNINENYQTYYDWLLEQKVIKLKVKADDFATNELIDDINTFSPAEVETMAKAYKAK